MIIGARAGRVLGALICALGIACETASRSTHARGPSRVAKDIAVSLPAVQERSDKEPAVASATGTNDDIVARLGKWALRKSDVYDHLMEQEPDQVKAALAVMLSQRVVDERCRVLGISISDEELQAWFVRHQVQLKKRVSLEYGTSVSLARYLEVNHGQSLDQYQRVAVDRERAFRLMARVVRFAQLTEDRVRLSLISVPDRDAARRLKRKLEEGADFGRLARQESSHSSAAEGGALSPMWIESLNIGLKEAVKELVVGQVSGVVDARDELGRRQFFIIRLQERIAARKQAYSQLQGEIEKGLQQRPLGTEEFVMWQARINNQVELVPEGR